MSIAQPRASGIAYRTSDAAQPDNSGSSNDTLLDLRKSSSAGSAVPESRDMLARDAERTRSATRRASQYAQQNICARLQSKR
ncbi:hypothetical protein WS71_18905 [Burkholderia mayonis]|uniref:Uncharacterized protein n=1 Tax=Burkholderia mayonis TaxID=1385591 RepID=A0A1B4G0I6_9BURK|nr:hypothetical protein WS71_18905 [Burkholderia mayonis]KVE48396.1 hypothetical protein WS71_18325 [Burkholderia mayonis]